MNTANYTIESILRESVNCHKYTLICALVCFMLVVLISRYSSKLEYRTVYLPLLCNLPIYIWCAYASSGLIDAYSGFATSFSAAPLPFHLAAIYQYIPLAPILLLTLLTTLITDRNCKFRELPFHNVEFMNLLPAILIGAVSMDWVFVWYLLTPRF